MATRTQARAQRRSRAPASKKPLGSALRALEAGLVDLLESQFVERGKTVEQIAELKSVPLSPGQVREALLAVGLEVEGQVRSGLTPQSEARFEIEASQPRVVLDQTW